MFQDIYYRVETNKYFNGFSTTPALEYVVSNTISDFHPKMSNHLLTEIYLCTEGSGFFEVNNKRVPFKEGDIFIINPYVIHGCGASEKETLKYYILAIKNIQFSSSDAIFKYLYQVNGNKLPSYVDLLWDEINEMKDKFDNSRIPIVRNLLNIILTELKYITSTDVIPFNKKEAAAVANAVAQYINTHFNQTITADELSKMFLRSKSTIMHMFKATYQTTVFHYLTDRRIEEIKMWLRNSNLPISTIAKENGYATLPAFYMHFAERVGMTPTEYRNQEQKKIK